MSLTIKKCLKCGAVVEVINDCTCENCGIKCCGEQMQVVLPNATDGAKEKHIPIIEVVGNYIMVTVPHVMENDHYIEWIALDGEKLIGKKFFEPNDEPKAIFPYKKGSTVYAYCNKHMLWSANVQ